MKQQNLSNNSKDCTELENLEDIYKKTTGYDYFVYSKVPACWSEEHLNAAEEALIELENLNKLVNKLKSRLTVYFVPAGFAFKYQNTNGRKNNSAYFFNDKMTLTTEPLFQYFKNRLPHIKFINLEKFFKIWISNCQNCKNKFYFSDDGHWTSFSHQKISILIEKYIKSLN